MYIFQLNSRISQDCTRDQFTKLAGNGSGYCNQQFDLISLDNASVVIGLGAWGVKQSERNVALG